MLTYERLRELLDYDPGTGIFRWHTGVNRMGGKIAGSPHYEWGYLRIKIDRRLYASHRLAWLYVYGSFPDAEIDHINRVVSDNRIANLRLATDHEQACNKSVYKNNRVGSKGIRHRQGMWEARIQRHGIAKYLGRFGTVEAAIAAYQAAAIELHGKFANVDI